MNQKTAKIGMFLMIFGLGVANIVVTFANGGGFTSVGFLIGIVLCALAAARIWISLKGIG